MHCQHTPCVLSRQGDALLRLVACGVRGGKIKWRIHEDAKHMQARCRTEVFGLFAACIPQGRREQAQAQVARKRQGLVPDFLITAPVDGPERSLLYEVKCLHFGSSTYRADTQRCEAVARRARALPAEYGKKAREVDNRFCETLPDHVGPVQLKLRTFEPVRGLVFGAWGETSPDTEKLLTVLAHIGATRHWRGMRCKDATSAVGALAWMLRRRWALTALRENARLKLERLEFVGRGAEAAVTRRVASRTAHEARARSTAMHCSAGPALACAGPRVGMRRAAPSSHFGSSHFGSSQSGSSPLLFKPSCSSQVVQATVWRSASCRGIPTLSIQPGYRMTGGRVAS